MGDTRVLLHVGSRSYSTQGSIRLLKWLALLTYVLMFAVCAGCGGKGGGTKPENRAPTINGVMLDPRRAAPGDTITATAIAGDPEGLPLTYLWRVNKGVLLDSLTNVASWVAPDFASTCSLVVIVSDGTNQASLTTVIPVGVGTLTVESYPQGATVLIDNEPTSYVTPVTIDPAPVGTYTIAVRQSPFVYIPVMVSLQVTDGNASKATFRLDDAVMTLVQVVDRPSECASQTCWSPDGTRLAVAMLNMITEYRNIELFREPWPDSDVEYLPTGDNSDWCPSWGVNGEMLFASDKTGTNMVYRVPVSGGTPQAVYPAVATNFPAWSWDALYMAFVADDGAGGFSLVTRSRAGGLPVTLAQGVVEDRPSWSPDRSQIVFTKLVDGVPYLFTVPANGGTALQISHVPGLHPQWSPDGTKIVFVSPFGGSSGLWVLFLDKGPEALDGWLTTGGEDWPTWRAPSDQLSFAVPSPSANCRTPWVAYNFPF